MNYKMVFRVQSWIFLIESVLMVPPLLISLFTHDGPAVRGFLVSIFMLLVVGGVLWYVTRNADRHFYAREGMLATGLAWLAMSLLGGMPFFISGRIPNFIDAFFEIVSGFTTTGASILSDVEALGKGLLYWRSFSHWVGGMGILVFFLAIVPVTGNNSGFTLHILRAESPGPEVNKMVPRMRDSAGILYMIYCAMTALDIMFLLLGKMPVFDAFCIAYGTAGTGGFSVLNTGCATYTPFAQWVTTIFMLLFGVNFGLYYLMAVKKFKLAFRDEELHLYFGIVVASTVVICVNLFAMSPAGRTVSGTIREAAFTVASIITTTGYSVSDFDLWPACSKTILVFLMFAGASAGSTGGGIKNVRLLLLVKSARRNVHQMFHPNEVRVIRLNGSKVSEQTVSNVNSYLACYVLIIIVSVLLISADPVNYDFETNFTAVMATFNNIGPGLGKVGPTQNFSGYNNFSTLILSFDMLLGRLEIFPILAVLSRSSYRK
ncbi:MAG: TrkH family potassium uptake protein [Lachnospiraceae bacterium]|nr:TrkH family potassium uptake protein [Lachnospiraceae bacterium]